MWLRLHSRTAAAALAAAACLAATACCDAPAFTAVDPAALRVAAADITEPHVRAHVAWLADDRMRGRRTTSRELGLAADYIADQFQGAGLAPGGTGGEFLQPYPCFELPAWSAESNVIALRRGSDPRRRGEWVVVSAHFDHVGVGRPDARGDSIYNGADDNASGTAALLEVARAFASLRSPPARSLAFVAVSGEEEGMVGSDWFVAHPPAAIGTMVANLNLDMLGRNAPDLLYLVGDTLSTLGDVAWSQLSAHPELGFVARSFHDETYRFSDQQSFAIAGTPALLLHAGSHPELHTPADELGLIDTDKVTRVARLALFIAATVADDARRPAWTPAGDRVRLTLRRYSTCTAAAASAADPRG